MKLIDFRPFLGFLGTIKYYLLIESYYRFASRFSRRRGITDTKRTPPLIVSLTTISERIDKIHLCIEALLQQSLKPGYLLLRVSQPKNELPISLLKFQQRGLEIRYCRDTCSYRKIIYTLKEYPKSIITTAVDDLLYPRNWLENLFVAYQNEPDFLHCHKGHQMTMDSNGNLFTTLPPTADDVWLKAMSLLNNTLCKKIKPFNATFTLVKGTQTKALWKENTKKVMTPR